MHLHYADEDQGLSGQGKAEHVIILRDRRGMARLVVHWLVRMAARRARNVAWLLAPSPAGATSFDGSTVLGLMNTRVPVTPA